MSNGTVPSPSIATPGVIDVRYRPAWGHDQVITGAHVGIVDDTGAFGAARPASGLAPDLAVSRFVLDRATRDASGWLRHAPSDFQLFVSVAANDLASLGFVNAVRHALHESALKPPTLTLQRTTSGHDAADPTSTLDAIDELSAMGVTVVVSDPNMTPEQAPSALTARDFTLLLLDPTTTPGAERPLSIGPMTQQAQAAASTLVR